MSDKGVYYLSKAKWTSVTYVCLRILCRNRGRNRISNKGFSYLKKTEWQQLRRL